MIYLKATYESNVLASRQRDRNAYQVISMDDLDHAGIIEFIDFTGLNYIMLF